MSRADADVVIAGAGPAGSATAIRLARAGLRVILLDRAHHPRAKPCGDCLNPGAVRELDNLGMGGVVEAEGRPLAGWRIRSAAGTAFDGRFRADDQGLAIDRARLDAALASAAASAGADLRCGERVTDLVHADDRVTGVRLGEGAGAGRTIRARAVIGADGLRSVVARRLELVRRPARLRKVALTARCHGLESLHEGDGGGVGELRLDDAGCVGVAEIAQGLHNVTVVASGAEIEVLARDPEAYFDRMRRRVLADRGGGERAGEVLRTGPFDVPVRRAGVPGALLVGDSAGYYDPFTGQGIFRALRGARLAAGSLIGMLEGTGSWKATVRGYDLAHRRSFAAGRGLQRVIEAVLSRPRLLEPLARRLHARPRAADALIRVVGDTASPATLLHPRLLASLLLPLGPSIEGRAA